VRLRAAVAPLLVLVLAVILVQRAWDALPYQFGMDFYQLWGVPVAHRIVGASPFREAPAYAKSLDAIADASSEASLKRANSLYRDSLVPMATPLLDASFSWLPADYDAARLVHLALLYLATGAAVFLLARVLGIGAWFALAIALLVELTFNPFAQDLRVGNVNSLQLLFMAAMLVLARRGPPERRWLAFPALLVFAALKPNTVWIAAALALQAGLVLPRREVLRGIVAAAVAGLVAYAWTAWFFSDAGVWLAWLRSPQGMNSGVMPASFIPGNRSLPLFLSLHSPAFGLAAYSLICGAAVAGLVAAAARSAGSARNVASVLRECLADPWFAATLGIAMTYATSPMVWPHYHLFLVLPILWLVYREKEMRVGAACAAIAYLVLSTLFIALLVGLGHYALLDLLTMLSWTLVLPGLAAHVRGVARAKARAAP